MQWKMTVVLAVVRIVFAGAVGSANGFQSPVKIKDVRQDISLTQDVKVGTTVLASGQYRVSSKDQQLTFRRLMEDSSYGGQWLIDTRQKAVVVKVTAVLLNEKSAATRMEMPPDSAGIPVLKSITLSDTNIKFTLE